MSAEGLTFGIHNHYFKNRKFDYESTRRHSKRAKWAIQDRRMYLGPGPYRIVRLRHSGRSSQARSPA